MKKINILVMLILFLFSPLLGASTQGARSSDSYTLTNIADALSAEETDKIRDTLTACADIMRFDSKNYDYDTLFKYVLYTHKNFQILTDIPAGSGRSSSLGYNNVSIVKSDYIDFIMKNVFQIEPQKPPVNNLLPRGFCYSDGYYYYTGGFDVYFATEIKEIESVYDIGGGARLVVFSDIYQEGDTKTRERSFAVLQKTDGYALLRLGMGETLPEIGEIRKYSPFSGHNEINWAGHTPSPITESGASILVPTLILIISVCAVGVILSIILLVKNR